MGSSETKLNYRNAFVELSNKTQPIDANKEEFWSQFWNENLTEIRDLYVLVPASEIRLLREESPGNLATLCFKAVERLSQVAESASLSHRDRQAALNSIRLLTRIIPYMFEEPNWRTFFWSALPTAIGSENEAEAVPLAQTLVASLCDLIFCPDFTVSSQVSNGPEGPEDMHTIDSCEYIWEAGVGFAQVASHNAQFDANRTEVVRLLLTCFSETMYLEQATARTCVNRWIAFFTGAHNRHVLPIFVSLLNVVCAYNPVSSALPYNHLVFEDSLEPLVEVALQTLCVALETDRGTDDSMRMPSRDQSELTESADSFGSNLFVSYMSRIHRDEDFSFILDGIARLLNNPLTQTYLPGSAKKVQMHQELLILFWRLCDINRKFMFYVLKSSRVLDILVPILYHLHDARGDKSRLGLMHIGVFILLLLSGERNFGVRLNRPHTSRPPMDVAIFTGNYADLLIIVFHKIITNGHHCLQPLFDCLLTIIVNVSPYIKSLSMVSATKLMHLAEAFSQPWFLFSSPTNHQLILFLLEAFNNIIQYQFDGNSCLVYTIIRKRQVFYQLASLPTSASEIRSELIKHAGSRFLYTGNSPLVTPSTLQPPSLPQDDADLEAADIVRPSDKALDNEVTPEDTHTDGEQSNHNDTEVSEVRTLQTSLLTTPTLPSITDRRFASQPGLHKQGSVEASFSHDGINTPLLQQHSPAELRSEQTSSRAQLNLTFGTAEHGTRASEVTMGPLSVLSDEAPVSGAWRPTPEWIAKWKSKLPMQTIMRLLQVLVPQVEKICIEKGLTDESEIIKFLQNGTLVGLLPVPHPILIRKYQSNLGTAIWFRNYMWGLIYLRNTDPPIWYDTKVRLFEVYSA